MDMKGYIVMPHRSRPHELSAEQSYPKLLELMRDIERERGHSLTDKQVNALEAFVKSLIDAKACIKYYDQ